MSVSNLYFLVTICTALLADVRHLVTVSGTKFLSSSLHVLFIIHHNYAHIFCPRVSKIVYESLVYMMYEHV